MQPPPAGTGRLVMARYGELFLKSEPVKRHFIGLLVRNINKALTAAGHSFRFDTPRGRILIFGDHPDEIAEVVSRIFGIVDVSVCTLTGKEPEDLARASVALAALRLRQGMSFAVRAKRQQKVGLSSQELGTLIGSAIYDAVSGLRVDLDCPDYELFAEIRDFGGLVYDSRIPAPGGLPFGTQGRVLCLLSSGIDSPVAAWLMMKRGCDVTSIHLDGGRWAGADVRQAAIENHRRLSLWCAGNPLPLVIADIEPLYDRMASLRIPPRYRCVICKRFMQRVASRLMEQEGALAITTGENLGQVASQTLPNLAVVSQASPAPVLRPLITYDKEEIVTLARKIGTFDPHPGDLACRAVPKMPATAADATDVVACEEQLGIDDLLRHALSHVEYLTAIDGSLNR